MASKNKSTQSEIETTCFNTGPLPSTSPLVIMRQQSLAQERFASNGVQKIVHVVVKNQPFVFDLNFSIPSTSTSSSSSSSSSSRDRRAIVSNSLFDHTQVYDFNHIAINAELLYDTDEMRRVDFVKKKPLEFKAHINESADCMTVEMRMKVLSSQLEDMHFRIRFCALNATSKEPIANLTALSQPIKVVSKPEQVHKIQAPAAPRTRKRKANADLDELMERLDKQHAEQRVLLQRILDHESTLISQSNNILSATNATATATMAVVGRSSNVNPITTATATATATAVGKPDQFMGAAQAFESTFQQLLTYYSLLSPEERPAKIRKLVINTPSRESEKLSEMLDNFQYELQRDAPSAFRRSQRNASTDANVEDVNHLHNSNGSTEDDDDNSSVEGDAFTNANHSMFGSIDALNMDSRGDLDMDKLEEFLANGYLMSDTFL